MYAAHSAAHASMLSPSAQHLLVQSARLEELAQEILWRKKMLVELDKQRQEAMQALATFREKKSTSTSASASSSSLATTPTVVPSSLHAPPPQKLYVNLNNNFVRMPRAQVSSMLQNDKDKLEAEIENVRSEMKGLMRQLQDLQASANIPKGLLDFALKP